MSTYTVCSDQNMKLYFNLKSMFRDTRVYIEGVFMQGLVTWNLRF